MSHDPFTWLIVSLFIICLGVQIVSLASALIDYRRAKKKYLEHIKFMRSVNPDWKETAP